MGFKLVSSEITNFNTPQEMYEDYKRKKIPGLLNHQSDMIDGYMKEGLNSKNVALELPTGSGKTLIGLVIGEYRRRKNKEKVLYLCPTNQLVEQTVNQAREKYGIKVNAFTGKFSDYSQVSKSEYTMCEAIAVTNYSSFFNSYTFFKDPDLIIFDDAHSAEQYISSNWSVTISRNQSTYYKSIIELIKKEIPDATYFSFADDNDESYRISDINARTLIDKVPNVKLIKYHQDLYSLIESYSDTAQIGFPWENIKKNLNACNLYLSYDSILIRPVIPPTETHSPFKNAKQKLFMSATLGLSGELERITGVEEIKRLEISSEWKRKCVGRRYFMFPNLFYPEDKNLEIVEKLTQLGKRSVFLVESNVQENKYTDYFATRGFSVYSGKEIESKKDLFCISENAIAILANRYDGVDFPEDESHVLIISDIPKNTHIQEKFLTSRMCAPILFEERVRTRFLQSIGRCTRSLVDYAVVCIFGDEVISNFLTPQKIGKLHAEIQSEINFGINQSKVPGELEDYIDLADKFLENGEEWQVAEHHLITERNRIIAESNKDVDEVTYSMLREASKYEVRYQYAIWRNDYVEALNNIDLIISALNSPKLKGYRGFWYYMGSYVAYLSGNGMESATYKKYLKGVTDSTLNVSWFSKLGNIECDEVDSNTINYLLEEMVEKIENQILLYGYQHGNKFEKKATEILDLLNSNDGKKFEKGHELLGTFIGYNSENSERDGDPDPWWIINDRICIVSEDKIYKSIEHPIPIEHVRQADSHKKWIMDKFETTEDKMRVITVLITNNEFLHDSATKYANDIYYVHRDAFVSWALKAIDSIRKIRRTFVSEGDLEWRATAADILISEETTPLHYIEFVTKTKLNTINTK